MAIPLKDCKQCSHYRGGYCYGFGTAKQVFSTAEALLCGTYTPLGQVQIGPLDSLAGQLTAYQIPDAIISTLKLADLAVSTAKLSNAAVTAIKIANGVIANAKIAADAAIDESKLNLDQSTADLLLAATYLAHNHSVADPTQVDFNNLLNINPLVVPLQLIVTSNIISKHTDSLKRDVTGSRLGLLSTPDWNDGTFLNLHDSSEGFKLFYDGVEIAQIDSTGNLQIVGDLTVSGGKVSRTGILTIESIGNYLRLVSGTSKVMYFDAGGLFTWRDADDTFATRMTLDSATGDLAIEGNLTLLTDLYTSDPNGTLRVRPSLADTNAVIRFQPSGTANYGAIELANSGDQNNFGLLGLNVAGLIASIHSAKYGTGVGPSTLNINDPEWDTINIGDDECILTFGNDLILPAGKKVDGVDVSELAAKYDALLMLGSGNAAMVPCSVQHIGNSSAVIGKTYGNFPNLENVDTTDFSVWYLCPKPTNKDTFKLYVGDVWLDLWGASAGDYINEIQVVGVAGQNDMTTINSDPANKQAAADIVWDFTPKDASSYKYVLIRFIVNVTNPASFKIGTPELECYYAAT